MSKKLTNYCSCVFQVKSKGKKKYSPYAVCAKSVYKGKKAPGALACRFDKTTLKSYSEETLRGWAEYEKVASKSHLKMMNKQHLVDMIYNHMQKPPKRDIRVASIRKRQTKPKSVLRREALLPKKVDNVRFRRDTIERRRHRKLKRRKSPVAKRRNTQRRRRISPQAKARKTLG